MITIGTLPFAVLLVLGPELFGLILGARWTEAGVYTQILIPQLFTVLLLGSILTLYGTLGMQEMNLKLAGLNLILRLAALICGGLLLHDARLTLFLFMVANVLMHIWSISLLIRATKLLARRPLAHLMRCIVYVVPCIVPIAAMKWLFSLDAVYLVALTPVFSIPYVALVLRHDLELRNLFLKYLRKARSLF
jgi:O-antigen/teichoic acid export membrane protein